MEKKKAIALRYPEGVDAPVIVAKGEGAAAQQIIDVALENEVYITEDTTLVNMLGGMNCGEMVPEQAWEALAVIFAFILGEKDELK